MSEILHFEVEGKEKVLTTNQLIESVLPVLMVDGVTCRALIDTGSVISYILAKQVNILNKIQTRKSSWPPQAYRPV